MERQAFHLICFYSFNLYATSTFYLRSLKGNEEGEKLHYKIIKDHM